MRDAQVKALMMGYNKINGVSCSEDDWLINNVLREEWGFDGLITSDWQGTYSTIAAAKVGVDLEMPGPSVHRGEKLVSAVHAGDVTGSEIEARVRRVIEFASRATFDPLAAEKTLKDSATGQLIRQVAAEGTVLLKNSEHLLPLRPGQRIAVVGIPARTPLIKAGGSSTVAEEELVTPLEALKVDFPDLTYHPGVPIFKKLPPPPTEVLGQSLVSIDWYNGSSFDSNRLLKSETVDRPEVHVFDHVDPALEAEHCVRMHFSVTACTTGTHTFGMTSSGMSKVYVNGELCVEFPGFKELKPSYILQPGDYELRGDVVMESGKIYEVQVESFSTVAKPPPGFRICPQAIQLGFAEPISTFGDDATNLDAVVLFVGSSKDYESESFDRDSISLPLAQNALVRKVSATFSKAKTVVVNYTGSPVTMPWIDEVSSCLQAWYPGQQAGNSIADVLTGRVNPSGRLPVSFPKRLEDTSSFGNFPASDSHHNVNYAEGLLMGYRHHLQGDAPEPEFYFGHGLSYTNFEYCDFSIKGDALACSVHVKVKNVGAYSGKEVVQIYVRPERKSDDRPLRELKGFVKASIEPGQSVDVVVQLDGSAFSQWSVGRQSWIIPDGVYKIEICRSAAEPIMTESSTIDQKLLWMGLKPRGMKQLVAGGHYER